jgi:hypothetical protein
LAALSPPAFADPVITDFTVTETTITLLFTDDGTSNQFELEQNPNLDPLNWGTAPGTLTNLGGRDFRYTLPRAAADRMFFRVVGSFLGTGLDPDGDGLPTSFEQSLSSNPASPLYSNPADFDTDNDGYSDGVEYAYGSQPNNRLDTPEFNKFPAVSFVEPNSSFIEGSASHLSIPLEFDQPYFGTIAYTVNTAASTASNPADYGTVSGTALASGTSATIQIPITDNLTISPVQKLLVIQLSEVPPTTGYRVAGGSLHVVCLCDDDAYWSGIFKEVTTRTIRGEEVVVDGLLERNFRIRVLRQGSTTQMAFVSGTSDGLPDTENDGSSRSTGLVPSTPQEIWPVVSATDSPTSFAFTSPAFPIVPSTFAGFNGSARITDEAMTRRLTFLAQANHPEHLFSRSTHYLGPASEIVSPVDPTKTYLAITTPGRIMLVKDIQPPPNPVNPLDPRNP